MGITGLIKLPLGSMAIRVKAILVRKAKKKSLES
jgi:hypothetical protein